MFDRLMYIFCALCLLMIFSCKENRFISRKYTKGIYREQIKKVDHINYSYIQPEKQNSFRNIASQRPETIDSELTPKGDSVFNTPSEYREKSKHKKHFSTVPEPNNIDDIEKRDKKITRIYTISSWLVMCIAAIVVEIGILPLIILAFILCITLGITGAFLLKKLRKREYDTFSQKWKIILAMIILFGSALQIVFSVFLFWYLYV